MRPDWVTFEEGPVDGPFRRIPKNYWLRYREKGRGLPEPATPPAVPGSFRRRAFEDVLYNLSSMAGVWLSFPHYAAHGPLIR